MFFLESVAVMVHPRVAVPMEVRSFRRGVDGRCLSLFERSLRSWRGAIILRRGGRVLSEGRLLDRSFVFQEELLLFEILKGRQALGEEPRSSRGARTVLKGRQALGEEPRSSRGGVAIVLFERSLCSWTRSPRSSRGAVALREELSHPLGEEGAIGCTLVGAGTYACLGINLLSVGRLTSLAHSSRHRCCMEVV